MNKQTLAREILAYYSNLSQEYGITPHEEIVIDLAQLVLEEEERRINKLQGLTANERDKVISDQQGQ